MDVIGNIGNTGDPVDPDRAAPSHRSPATRARPWQDTRFDGRFIVADRSTRVYCRPSCPLPSSRACDTRFFLVAAAAAEAGFRPCVECRPETAPPSPVWTDTPEVVVRAMHLIETGLLDRTSVGALAARLDLGERHLRRLLVHHVRASPLAVAQTRRLQFAKRLLDQTDLPMPNVAVAAGYGSVRRFNAAFRRNYRLTPSELRRRRPPLPATPGGVVALRLPYRPPLDWRELLAVFGRRAIAGVERIHGDTYTRCVDAGGHRPAVIAVRPGDVRGMVEAEIRGAPAFALHDIVHRVQRMFDLTLDPAQVARAFQHDPRLAPLVREAPGLRLPGDWDVFESAVRLLLGGGDPERERIMVARLLRRCGLGTPASTPAGPALAHPFPRPERVTAARLSGIGLSAACVENLRAIAGKVINGNIDATLSAKELTGELLGLPGMRLEAAQWIAARALGARDAYLPVTPRQAAGTDADWRPWRSYARLYLSRGG